MVRFSSWPKIDSWTNAWADFHDFLAPESLMAAQISVLITYIYFYVGSIDFTT